MAKNQSHDIEVTKEMEEILVGTLLGDGYITCRSKSINKKFKDTGILIFAHCLIQKEYCFHKYEKLKNLFSREPQYNEQIRNNKINISYYAQSISSISLKKYWEIFYKDGVKIIPDNIGDYFTPQSLAYLFMDDGNKSENSFTIALCNFDENSLNILQDLLLKWNIETTIWKNHVMYIKAKSKEMFLNLICPYIIPSMKYKISNEFL